MRRSNAPTLRDVADAANVSVMMASVVLNGAQSSTRVSASTRDAILEVAARLNYRRNAVARGLSRQRMDTIGVTACVGGDEVNFYFLAVLNGILEEAVRHGQNTTIFSLSHWLNEAHRLLDFCDGRVDGMILIAPDIQSPEKLSHHTPFVTIHGNESEPTTFNLGVDNEGAAYGITRYLVDQGHRRIVHFSGSPEHLEARQRIDGFRRALREAAIPCAESSIVHGTFSVASGRRQMAQLLERAQPPPTAIFCGSDAIAAGGMEVLAGRGLHVPQDISIAGFDDSVMAGLTRPPLTTVRQPFREMGRCAVEKLLALIEGQESGPSGPAAEPRPEEEPAACLHTRVFPTEMVIRETVGPPRAEAA